MRRLLIVIIALSVHSFGQSWCASGVQAGSNPSVTCSCSNSYSAHSATVPNNNDARIYAECHLTSAGTANLLPEMVVWHGGVSAEFFNSVTIPTMATMTTLAQKGRNVFAPAYTNMNIVNPTATIGSGATSIAVKGLITGAAWYWMTSATPNFGIIWDDGTGDVMTVTACSPCANTASTMTVSRTVPTSTHATTANGTLTAVGGGVSVQWPVPGNDMAAFYSYLGTCSPGGTVGQNTGVCTGFSPAGNPQLISVQGHSTGAGYTLAMILQSPGCLTGVGCSFLNTTPGTPGYSEWSAPWHINNPQGAVPIEAVSPATDLAAGYNAMVQNGTFPNSASNAAVELCGTAPVCNDVTFNVGTLHCASPSASFTACTNMDVLAILNGWYGQTQANFPVPVFEQTGTTDNNFGWASDPPGTSPGGLGVLLGGSGSSGGTAVLLGGFPPITNVSYVTGHDPQTAAALTDEINEFGVNPCYAINNVACPLKAQAAGGIGTVGGVQ